MEKGNVFAGLPADRTQETFEVLAEGSGTRIERIVSFGQASPEGFWYDQEMAEWVMVVRGRAGLEIEGQPGVIELSPGDHLDLPAHCRHRVAWTAPNEPTVWLAVHYRA
jgi:cupin 2 domain-containing protein